MSADTKSRTFSESLLLADSAEGVIIKGITDDSIAAKSGLQAGDEIVAATIHLDHLNKNEVMNILKVLEPYDDNMTVLTKKELSAGAGLGSLGLGLKDPKMLNKDLSLDTSAQAPAVSLDGLNGMLNASRGLGGEIGGPTLNGDLPNLSLNKPTANAGTNFTMPSLGLTGPDINGDLDGNLKAPDVSVSTPKLNTPSASLDIDKPEFKTGNMKYKPPKFAMPHFGLPQLKTPKTDMDVSGDLDLPSVSGNLETPDANLSAPKFGLNSPNLDLNGPKVDLNGPGLDLQTPNADIDGPSGKVKWPHLKWKGPKVKGPDADLNADLSAPDVSITPSKIDGNLSAPDVDMKTPGLDVQTPNVDIDAPSGKINWPHLKWKKPKLGAKGDLDLNTPDLNTPDFDASLPKVEGGINAPDVDLNMPKADLKGPDLNMETPNIDTSGKINWPHRKWKKPKLQADLNTPDLSVAPPKVEGDINVPNAELNFPKADLNGPNVDVQGTDLDINAPSGKVNWPHLKWKKPKINGPKTDMDLNADLSTPDVDLSGPKIDGGLSTPDVDLNLPKADADIDAPSGKIRFPTLKKPKFLLSGPKVKGPDVDLDADVKAPDLNLSPPSLGGPDVDINVPKADVDLNLPSANIEAPHADIEAPSGKFKWPTLRKPKWSVSGPKVDGPDADLDANLAIPDMSLSTPKIDGDINSPDLNLNVPKADIGDADLDLNAPDIEGPSGKMKWFNFKKPKFGTWKGPKGDIDADVKVPSTDVELNAPNIEGGIKAPELNMNSDLDVNGPDIDPDIGGKLKFPKLPKFNMPKVKGPELDADLKAGVDAPNVDLKAPDLSLDAPDLDVNLPTADLKGPGVDLQAPDVDASAGKLKLPKINIPKFGMSGPRIKGPNLNVDADSDVNLQAADLNLSAPNLKGDLSAPDVDLDADLKTDIDLSPPKTDISVPDFSLPTMKTNLPDADVKGLNLDGNLSAPNIDAELPNAQLKTPGLESSLGDFNMPHFKLPKLGLSSPDVEVPSVNPSVEAGVEAPNVNIGAPKGDANISVPGVDLSLPKLEGDINGPSVSAPEVKKSLNMPDLDLTADADADIKGSPKKMKWPFKWGMKGTDEEGSAVKGEISPPDVSVSAPEVKTSLDTPELDMTAEADADAKSKLKWPFKWGAKSGSGTDEEGNDSEAEVELPLFKVHKLPRNNIDGMMGIDDTMDLLKLDTETKDYVVSKGIRLPIINSTSNAGEKVDIMERLKLAKEKAPSPNVSPSESKTGVDLKLAAPSLDAGDSSLVRGGTYKVEKPESPLNLVTPEISTSDENDKMSLSLSNMLGLNVKD